MITPTDGLLGFYSKCEGEVEFSVRRSNGVITMQWEPFQAIVNCFGTEYLCVTQGFAGLPKWECEYLIRGTYCGNDANFSVIIDPGRTRGVGTIYFKLPHPTRGANEFVSIPGSCITWHAANYSC